MTNSSDHSQKWLPLHSLKLSLGFGLGLWMISASGLNTSLETSISSPLPIAKNTLQISDIYGTDDNKLASQRSLFKQAEHALNTGHYRTYTQLVSQLEDYPLYQYLRFKEMRKNPGQLTRQTIDNFFQQFGDNQISSRLRSGLLKYYARTKRWDDFLHLYQDQNSITMECHYLTALLNTGQKDKALQLTEPLWLSAKSQPKACNKAFTAWNDAGLQTTELTWKRIQLAMSKGRTQLASHLADALQPDDRKWVNKWIKIHRSPQLASSQTLFSSFHPMSSTIQIHAIKRQARKDINKAVDLWADLNQQFTFTDNEKYSVYKVIGLAMARSHHPDANQWLTQIPAQYSDTETNEWLIRTYIRHANWQQMVDAIEALPEQDQSNLRWQFWWAYANEQLGYKLDAEGIYHYLAGRRSYYGFLAADRLDLPYAFENRPLDIENYELATFSHYPEIIRAKEFYEVGKITDARREWHQLASNLSNRDMLIASKLAQHWGWHDRAIVTMGKTDYRDDIELRFPLPLKEKVAKYSQRSKIEPALTYAIIRRESAFMADARSSQGALGLMQIQPRTARFVARSMKVHYRGIKSLLQEDTNIKLGTGYLSKMLKNHDSQPVLATAAYNAGPHRVKTWLPETEEMAAVRWIETIPFAETREYVSNVLAYTTIYQHLMNNEYTRLSNRMPPVQPKNTPEKTAQITQIAPITNLKI
ncbi:MAG: transglycosylase SLT domain-containing protein, partial [Gammaproteobacteria bacterium]|nr:transglycosylase SLT domain-containing protein [Gammaproteobacteria bacterium]